ncbi:hypothetical protein [uncultured Propionibacterium sp.]|uniref:hypothetical protein n=1 Tax=uncultured Propionibacterium sp. TaxID=218066 RepID=UPI00292CC2BF|nr:hypothetical protein [uncultured Propionibacterium sp.]
MSTGPHEPPAISVGGCPSPSATGWGAPGRPLRAIAQHAPATATVLLLLGAAGAALGLLLGRFGGLT